MSPYRKQEQALIRVVVVNSAPPLRDALVTVLESAAGLQVVGVGTTTADTLRFMRRLRPADEVAPLVLVLGLDEPFATVRRVMQEVPSPIILVVEPGVLLQRDFVFEAQRVGVLAVIGAPSHATSAHALIAAGCGGEIVRTVRVMAGVTVGPRWEYTALKTVYGSFHRPDPLFAPSTGLFQSAAFPTAVAISAGVKE